MNVDAALETGPQLAKGCQSSVGVFDHPPMAPEPVIALHTSAGDTVPNTATPEVSAAPSEVVALVRM